MNTSTMNTASVQRIPNYSTYDLLRVYTYYRTLLGSLLLLMFQGQVAPTVLGYEHPTLFFLHLGHLYRLKHYYLSAFVAR